MLITVSLLVAALGIVFIFRAYKINKSHRKVYGRVVAHEDKGRDGWAPVIRFDYAGQEIVYVSDVGSAWTAKLPIGSTCPVYVNPENVNEIRDARPFYFWLRAVMTSLFGLVVAWLAYQGIV